MAILLTLIHCNDLQNQKWSGYFRVKPSTLKLKNKEQL